MIRAGQIQVSGGGFSGKAKGMTGVDAQLRAGGGHPLAIGVVPEGGEQPHIHPHQAHIMGDVPSHAPQTGGNPAWVGVRLHQGVKGAAADIHVDAPHHNRVASGAKDIALSGDAAFFGQVGDVDGNTGSGDSQRVGNGLLGDHGICFDQLKDLPFPLGHSAPPKHKFR